MSKHARAPDWDRAWGLHSNIPECCVEAYCIKNMPELPFNSRWGYRPCYPCFIRGLKEAVKVHICTTKCISFLKSLYFSMTDIQFIIGANRRKRIKESLNLRRSYERAVTF